MVVHHDVILVMMLLKETSTVINVFLIKQELLQHILMVYSIVQIVIMATTLMKQPVHAKVRTVKVSLIF